jgi:ankyrin repeat protein
MEEKNRPEKSMPECPGIMPFYLLLKEPGLDLLDTIIGEKWTMEPDDDDFISPYTLISIFGNRDNIRKMMLQNGADIYINAADRHGNTPLHIAIQVGNYEVAFELIAQKADISAKNKLGWQSIHLAIVQNHFEMVQTLLESGADVNAQQCSGWTPLHMAIFNRNKPMIMLLESKKKEK